MKYKAIFTSLVFLIPRKPDHQKPGPTTTISPASKREFFPAEFDGDNHFSRNEIVGFGM